MSSRCSRIAGLCLILGTLLPAVSTANQEIRVTLGVVYDYSRAGSIGALRRALETEMQATDGLRIVSNAPYIRSLRAANIPVDAWTSPYNIRRFSRDLDVDILFSLKLLSDDGRYRFLIEAHDPSRGELIARHSLRSSSPILHEDRARELLVSILEETHPDFFRSKADSPPAIPPRPDAPAQTHPVVDDGWEDDWGSDLNFGDLDIDTDVTDKSADIRGKVRIEHYRFIEDLDNSDDPGSIGRNAMELELEAKASASNVYTLGRVLIRRDLIEPWRNTVEIDEAFVDIQFAHFGLRAGSMITTWGTANLVNPTDVLNYRDSVDPLDTRKRPVLMASLRLDIGATRFQGYLLPVPQIDTLALPPMLGGPKQNSRWFLDLPLEEIEGVETNTEISPLVAPSAEFKNAQWAARMSLSALGADFSVSYQSLLDRLPIVRTLTLLQPTMPPVADVFVEFKHPRLHMLAFDMEYPRGNLRFATESMAVFPEQVEDMKFAKEIEEEGLEPEVHVFGYIEDPFVVSVISLDYRTRQFYDTHWMHFFLDVAITEPFGGSLPENRFGVFRYPLGRSLIGRAAYHFGTSLTLELNIVESLLRSDRMVIATIEYDMFETATLTVGAQIPMGSASNGLFGPFQDNRRVMCVLEASF